MALTTDTRIQKQTFSNRSYNNSGTCIRGMVNDLEALGQAIRKRLSTQQFEYPIYSFNYGVNWRDLIGQDQEYIRAEMQRRHCCRTTGSAMCLAFCLSLRESPAYVLLMCRAYLVSYGKELR